MAYAEDLNDLCKFIPIMNNEHNFPNCMRAVTIICESTLCGLKLIQFHNAVRVPIQFANNFKVPCMDIVRSDHGF